MIKYTCIIVDDEPLARQILQSYADKIPYLDVVAVCQNAIEAKLAIQEKKPDILYIDIQMPNLSG
jgi:YesN/AraC family two-component response regulator